MYESVSGTISNSVFAIQFSHKDKRKDETRRKHKTQKTKTKEERKKNEKETKDPLSLLLCE